MGGLECGRCTLVKVIREAQREAVEAEEEGLPLPRWRQQNLDNGDADDGDGEAARKDFLELLQLAFGAETSPFPQEVEVQAERARRAGLPWDRTVGGNPSSSSSSLLRGTAVRRSTLARCPRVLCLQLLRALKPEEKLRGGVEFGFVVDLSRFTAAGAEPLLPSWRGKREEEVEERPRPRPPVSDAEAEAAGAAPLRQFIVPLSSSAANNRQLPSERPQGPIYLLSSVVAHTGSGTSRGHYICYRRRRRPRGDDDHDDDGGNRESEKTSTSSSWCGCSDQRVWEARDDEVRRCEAVMLVYCRQ